MEAFFDVSLGGPAGTEERGWGDLVVVRGRETAWTANSKPAVGLVTS